MKQQHAKAEAFRVGRFGLVGIMNTVVDIVVLNVLAVTVLPKSLVIAQFTINGILVTITGLMVAGAISGTLAMVNSLIFNARFTFRTRHVSTRHIVYFFLITMFGLYVIRPIILKVFTDIWVWPADITYRVTSAVGLPFSRDFDERNLALFAAIAVVLVYNYLMYKKFVFVDEEATK